MIRKFNWEEKMEFRKFVISTLGLDEKKLNKREVLELYGTKEMCLMADGKIEVPIYIINKTLFDSVPSADKAINDLNKISKELFLVLSNDNADVLDIYIAREVVKSHNAKLANFIFKTEEEQCDI